MLSLVAFVFFMNVVAMVLGFGMGLAELLLWLGVLVAGLVLIVRRYDNATHARLPGLPAAPDPGGSNGSGSPANP